MYKDEMRVKCNKPIKDRHCLDCVDWDECDYLLDYDPEIED